MALLVWHPTEGWGGDRIGRGTERPRPRPSLFSRTAGGAFSFVRRHRAENRRGSADPAAVRHRDRRYDGGALRRPRPRHRRGSRRVAPRLRGAPRCRGRAGRSHDAGHRDLPARPGGGPLLRIGARAPRSARRRARRRSGVRRCGVAGRVPAPHPPLRRGSNRIVDARLRGDPGRHRGPLPCDARHRRRRGEGGRRHPRPARHARPRGARPRRPRGAPRRHRHGAGGHRFPRPRGALRVVLDLRGRRRGSGADRVAAPARRVPLPRHHAPNRHLWSGRIARVSLPLARDAQRGLRRGRDRRRLPAARGARRGRLRAVRGRGTAARRQRDRAVQGSPCGAGQ